MMTFWPLLVAAAPVVLVGAAHATEGSCITKRPARDDGVCGSALLQTVASVEKEAKLSLSESLGSASTCDEHTWPDRDHGLTCGDCKVLVNHFASRYRTCEGYCSKLGRRCVNAWEEEGDTCTVKHGLACDQTLGSSDAICECSAERSSEGSCSGQYAHLEQVVEDEGAGVGSTVDTTSAEECQRRCDETAGCESFTICPGWYQCWMKDRSLTGSEPTKQLADCRTFFKRGCDAAPPAEEAPSPTPAPTSGCSAEGCRTIEVMSYNTEYRNYDARMGGYADKIKAVAPGIVGLQECQNIDGLARLSGFTEVAGTGTQNYMLFDPSKVTLLSGGWMSIPRDDYAPRAITWGKFKLGDVDIWFFNTHLPHNHNEARDQGTHARIAEMLLQKRRELGAEHAPTIVVGDMNSHASGFNQHHTGGFESNLEKNGFVWAYTARGNPGYGGIDHILYSGAHWTHSGCSDTGTGGSDHTSITCLLTLK